MEEYYLFNSTCLPCSFGCSICSTSTACLTCNDGLYLTNTGSCAVCGVGVGTCTVAVIMTCQTGYFLLSNICAGCLTNCAECSDFVSCTKCTSGYYLSPSGTSCIACTTNCLTCNSASSCTQCQQGYTPIGSTCSPFNCTSLNIFCVSCTASTCLSCQPGKYLATNGSCLMGGSVLCV
jgi:hypothetical protein